MYERESRAMRDLVRHMFDAPMSDMNLLLKYLRREDDEGRQAAAQLHQELQHHVDVECKDVLHEGVKDCPLYTMLPSEIRHHIFSYLVCVPECIHIFPVKGNPRLGFRLSRCEDSILNLDSGTCNCESGFSPPANPPAYLDTALMLVSKTVRREALDLIFLKNTFTFTSMRDLANFTESFTACASKMQSIRLYARLSDHYLSCYAANNAAKARSRLSNLQRLELNCYLDDLSYYDSWYHDGFIAEAVPLAFPKPKDVKVIVRPIKIWRSQPEAPLVKASEIVQRKLDDVFSGRWTRAKDVPMSDPPKKKVPECEKAPSVKRGILALGD